MRGAYVPSEDNPYWDTRQPPASVPALTITVHPPRETKRPVGFAPWPQPEKRKRKRKRKKRRKKKE